MQPLTPYGYKKLTSELKNLKEVARRAVAVEIDTARSHGDLKENAEYHAAREKQHLIEKRIADLSYILQNSQVIDPSTLAHDKVSFGSSVKILNLDTDKEITYSIVGVVEADPNRGLISSVTPIAKALIGKVVGEIVDINLPSGLASFEILEIFYKELEFASQD